MGQHREEKKERQRRRQEVFLRIAPWTLSLHPWVKGIEGKITGTDTTKVL